MTLTQQKLAYITHNASVSWWSPRKLNCYSNTHTHTHRFGGCMLPSKAQMIQLPKLKKKKKTSLASFISPSRAAPAAFTRKKNIVPFLKKKKKNSFDAPDIISR